MKEVEELEEIQFETKFLEAALEKSADGTITAVASTNTVDRHGEVVDNNGWDLKAFKKNPILLWAHDHSQLPIGTSKRTWIEGAGKKAQLMIQPVIHEVTDQAKAIKQLIDDGVLKTLSVGFRPLESPDGVTFTKNELLEVSVVNVPANADAMMMAYKSLKSKGFDDELIEGIGIKAMDEPVMKSKMTAMKTSMDTANGHLTDMMDMMGMSKKIESLNVQVDELKDLVKVQQHQSKKHTEERLSMLKVIAKATDKVLEAENKQVMVDHKRLVKIVKRATELMTVAEKEHLHG